MTDIKITPFDLSQANWLQDKLGSLEIRFEKDAVFSHKIAELIHEIRQEIMNKTKIVQGFKRGK